MILLLFSFPLLSDMSVYCAWVQSRLPADEGHARRGLASASEETRQRVARKGGIAPHQKRGLAAELGDQTEGR